MKKGRRRAAWILVGVVGGIVLLAGGFLLAVRLTNPPPPEVHPPVAVRPLPPDWGEDVPPPALPTTEEVPVRPNWSSSGTLALEASGKAFGEEAYELDVSADGATLSSSGRFWFRIVVATLRVTFDQEWSGGPNLEPLRYTAHFDAPLGRSERLDASFAENRATVRRGSREETFDVVLNEAAVLGTFSTYALLPILFRQRATAGRAEFSALLFGGPPGSSAPAEDGLPRLVIEKAGTARLASGDVRVAADRYLVRSSIGDTELYARGDDFLLLTAGTSDRRLVVYRSDYFEREPRVELLAEPPP